MSTLRFRSLNIRRTPGISDGFLLDDLAAGVNVVFGPNASGKTSTSIAVEMLLWPLAGPANSHWLEASFELGGQRWRAELDAGQLRYERDEEPAGSPNGLPKEARGRYRFPLHELLSVDDRDLARAIALESAGGYDLAAAARPLSPRTNTSRPRREIEELRAARELLREARAVQDRLQVEAANLTADEARLADRPQLEARLELAKLVLQHAELRRDGAEARVALERFPEVLARLAGDEAGRARTLRTRIEESAQKARTSSDAVRAARGDLARLKVPETLLEGDTIESLIAEAATIERLDQDIRSEDKAVEQAREQLRIESGRLTPLIEADLERAALPDLNELVAWGGQLQEARATRLGIEAELRVLPEPPEDVDAARLEKAVFLLQQWLRTGHPGRTDPLLRWVAIATSVALLAGGTLLALLHPAGIVLSAAGLLLLAAVMRPSAKPDPRRLCEGEFAELGCPDVPESWQTDHVRACLDRLYDRLVEVRVAAEAAGRRQRLEADHAAAAEREEGLRASMIAAAATIGLEKVEAHSVPWVIERISRWQDARTELDRANARRVTAFGHRSAALARANERLGAVGEESVPDSTTLVARVRKLDERVRAHGVAEGVVRQAEAQLAAGEARSAELREELAALFARIGIGPDDEARLEEWCSARPAFLAARQHADTLDSERARLESRLRASPGFESAFLELAPHEAQTRVAELTTARAELDELRGRVIALRTNVDRATRGHEIEDALAEVDRCEAALRAVRDRDARSALAAALVAYVERVSRNQQRPEVFHRASTLFTRITRGRYELRLDDGDPPAFRAFDTQRERLQPLDELSSATRVQLLLAVRVAFVEVQEGGVRLPLLLDETLGNSDDDRAAAIMEAIAALAAEGRQIFYFTAQIDEVRKWRALLEKSDVEGKVFDLGEIRRLSRRIDPALLEVLSEPTPRLPDPSRVTHTVYGDLLGVPAVDPFAPLGSLHLWYLVEEPRALHQLLTEAGAEDWGGLRSFIDLASDRMVLPPIARRIEALAAAADATLARIRIGMSKKVDRLALISSQAISDKFMEPVTDLCRSVDWDAARLLAALEAGQVPRFLQRNIEALREFFEENSYLDDRTPLLPSRIRREVIEECAVALKDGVVRVAEIDRLMTRLGVSPVRRSLPRPVEAEPDFWAAVLE